MHEPIVNQTTTQASRTELRLKPSKNTNGFAWNGIRSGLATIKTQKWVPRFDLSLRECESWNTALRVVTYIYIDRYRSKSKLRGCSILYMLCEAVDYTWRVVVVYTCGTK